MIHIAFCQTNRLFILLERAEKEICFSMTNGMFKIKMDIDRHSPRRMPDNCKNLNPPYFSLPSTFKGTWQWGGYSGVFAEIGSSQAPYTTFLVVPILASNSRRYSYSKNYYSPLSPMRGVSFRIRISPRIRSQNRHGLKSSVRDLGQSDLCKNIGKTGSLPCPFKKKSTIQ